MKKDFIKSKRGKNNSEESYSKSNAGQIGVLNEVPFSYV